MRYTIGVLINWLQGPYSEPFYKSITETAKKEDINLIIFHGGALDFNIRNTFGDYSYNIMYKYINQNLLDGLIIFGPVFTIQSTSEIKSIIAQYNSLPIALTSLKIEGVPCVTIDNRTGMEDLFLHLTGDHHFTNIAYISGPKANEEAKIRLNTYKESLAAFGIKVEDNHIVMGNFSQSSGYNSMEVLIEDRGLMPDAVVAANDDMALGAMRYLKSKGIKIPEDIAVTGFDNLDIVRYTDIPMTTVHQPIYEMGINILILMRRYLETGNKPQDIVLSAELIRRRSCGCFGINEDNDESKNIFLSGLSLTEVNADGVIIFLTNKLCTLLSPFIINMDYFESWINDVKALIMSREIQTQISAGFLTSLKKIIDHTILHNADGMLWQHIISLISSLFSTIPLFKHKKQRMEKLLHSARIMTANLMEYYQGRRYIKKIKDDNAIKLLSVNLHSAFNMNDLSETLSVELPVTGIKSLFILLYEKPFDYRLYKKGILPKHARFLTAYKKEELISLIGESFFSPLELIPKKLLPENEQYSFIVKPLYFEYTHFGYYIIEASDMEPYHYENIRVVISSVIQGVYIIKKQKEAERQLELQKMKLEEANVKLKSFDKAKNDFLANMSHEIRTPLNAIIGLNQLLQKTELDSRQNDYVHKINISAQNLLRIINDILDFSKIKAGELSIESVPFHLQDVLAYISSYVGVNLCNKDIDFIFDIGKDVPDNLIGDALRIEQVILNFTSNALKFTKKGEILLSIKKVKATKEFVLLYFEIKDTGIGLTKEQLKKLFKKFSQADTTTTRKFGGTGLGLAICKALVNQMGGEIGVESEYGTGSCFYFSMEFKFPRETKTGLSLPDSLLSKMKILILYKNEKVCKILSRYVENISADTRICHLPSEVVTLYSEDKNYMETLDIVITDYSLLRDLVLNHFISFAIDGDRHLTKIIALVEHNEYITIKNIDKTLFDIIIIKPFLKHTILNSIIGLYEGNENPMDADNLYGKANENLIMTKKTMVLLVEDNEINMQVAKEMLENMGVIVVTAFNGVKALEILNSRDHDNPVNIILMDIQMPEMDGFEATIQIRKNPRFKSIPIIAMTADVMGNIRRRVFKAGMNEYISKPIEKNKLFRILSKWVNVEQRSESSKQQDKEEYVFPKLYGINVEKALQRLSGNISLLNTLLQKFSNDYASFDDNIRPALKYDNNDTAKLIIHTLKGVSGNICAELLHNIVIELDEEINKKDFNAQNVNSLITNASREIKDILSSFHDSKIFYNTQQKKILLKSCSASELIEKLKVLQPYLANYDTGAQIIVDKAIQAFSASGYEEEIIAIKQYVIEFEYEAAFKLVAKLFRRLEHKDGNK